jgi:hypothetical protein
MKNSTAVVLCLSAEAQQRITTGIYPEALDAIDAYRMYRPGEVFLIPVRLNDCEIPPIAIDGLRYLDSLQHLDLFPAEQRPRGLARLIAALKGDPLPPPAPPPPADSEEDIRRYLTDLKKETAFINIRGLQVGTGRAYRFPIDQLYISLTTTGEPGRQETDDTDSYVEPSDEAVEGTDWRVLRGGAFWNDRNRVRCVSRLWDGPGLGLHGRGFRCVQ